MSEQQAVYIVVTFEALCEVSPELLCIQEDAARRLQNPRDPYYWQKYEGLKRRLKSCAGWYAHPGLPDWVRSAEAYDVAHRAIFGGL